MTTTATTGSNRVTGPGIGGTGVDADLLEALMPHFGESIMVLDADWTVRVNLARPGGLIGRGLGLGRNTLEEMHPDDALLMLDMGTKAFDTEPGWEGSMVVRMQRGDGTYGRYEITATNRMDDPVVRGMVVRTREVIADSAPSIPGLEVGLAADLAEFLPTGVAVLDAQGHPVYLNQAACNILRCDPAEAKRSGLAVMMPKASKACFAAAVADRLAEPGHDVRTAAMADGRVVEITFTSFGDRTVNGLIVTLVDVTVRREAEEELEYRANHDALTGLRNRASILEVLRERIEHGIPTVVAYIDLDGFKAVNDAGGHAAGDHLLVSVGRELMMSLGDDATLARIGGDEFVVVADAARGVDLAREVADIVHDCRGADGEPVLCSVGVAMTMEGDAARDVLHRADEAMYQDKRSRRPGATAP
ncbi:MAG: sensor domain-containing diguanylate cyclase [Actinobacteria bacterium]|nr:sensor domain-containing diguanylate cyclase [Actinomycetota bacterium]